LNIFINGDLKYYIIVNIIKHYTEMCASGGGATSSGQTWRDNLSKRIVIDNGAYMIKYSSASETKP